MGRGAVIAQARRRERNRIRRTPQPITYLSLGVSVVHWMRKVNASSVALPYDTVTNDARLRGRRTFSASSRLLL